MVGLTYMRNNALPWIYEDSYFIYRGTKEGVTTRADNLVLARSADGYRAAGHYTTPLLSLPPGCSFSRLEYETDTPSGTGIEVRILGQDGAVLREDLPPAAPLQITQAVRLQFTLRTVSPGRTPSLGSYALSFGLQR